MKKQVRIALLAGVTLAVGFLPASHFSTTTHAASVSDTVAVVNAIFGDAKQCVTDFGPVAKDVGLAASGNNLVEKNLSSLNKSATMSAAETAVNDCHTDYGLVKAVKVSSSIPDAAVVGKLQVQVVYVTAGLLIASSDAYHQAKGDVTSKVGGGSQKDFVQAVTLALVSLNQVQKLTSQLSSDLHLKSNKALFKLGKF